MSEIYSSQEGLHKYTKVRDKTTNEVKRFDWGPRDPNKQRFEGKRGYRGEFNTKGHWRVKKSELDENDKFIRDSSKKLSTLETQSRKRYKDMKYNLRRNNCIRISNDFQKNCGGSNSTECIII